MSKNNKKKSYVKTPLLTQLKRLNGNSVSYKGLVEEMETLVKANGGRIHNSLVGNVTFFLKNETTKQAIVLSTDDLYLFTKGLNKNKAVAEALANDEDIQMEIFLLGGTKENAMMAERLATAKLKLVGEYTGWKAIRNFDSHEVDAQSKVIGDIYQEGLSLNSYYASTLIGSEFLYEGISKSMLMPREAVIIINEMVKGGEVTLGRCAADINPWEAAISSVLTTPKTFEAALEGKVLIQVIGVEELKLIDQTGTLTLDKFYQDAAENLSNTKQVVKSN